MEDDAQQSPADYIIGKFGSQSALSRALGHKNPTTVQRWHVAGFIPQKYWPVILDAAERENVTLTADDFVRHLKNPGAPDSDNEPSSNGKAA